jgi:hypothetical protein
MISCVEKCLSSNLLININVTPPLCFPFTSNQHDLCAYRTEIRCIPMADGTRMNIVHFVRFQVLTAASMKFRVFWHIAPCSQVEVDRCFRGAYCRHHNRPEVDNE